MKLGDDDVHVTRLIVQGASDDPITSRLRIEALLNAASLVPPSLPPAAILCIRQLRDPLPQTLALRDFALRPPAIWQSALTIQLEALARRAARPALGPVAANAEAVIFADRAEFLACLARDVLAGRYSERWWWRVLLGPQADIQQLLATTWQRFIEHVPAALADLATTGQARMFASALAPPAAASLLIQLVERFALMPLAPLLPVVAPSLPIVREPPTAPAVPPMTVALPPWHIFVPEAHEAQPPLVPAVAHWLLGLGLLIHRAPERARSATFAAALAAWSTATSPEVSAPLPHPAVTTVSLVSDTQALDQRQRIPAAATVPLQPPAAEHTAIPTSIAQAPRAEPPAPMLPLITPSLPDSPSPTAPAPGDAGRIDAAIEPSGSAASDIVPAPMTSPAAPEPPLAAAPHRPWLRPRHRFGPAIDTRLGGLFYLINPFVSLGLYRDETSLPLSLWTLLARVGERLLGDDTHPTDPVWPLLTSLTGDVPPDPAPLPDAWRVAPAWLIPFPEPDPWPWHISAEHRLVISHPAGFALIDVPRNDAPPAEQAHAEAAVFASLSPLTPAPDLPPQSPGATDAQTRFVAHLAAYLRPRLQRALGLDAATDIARLVLCHPARIHHAPAQLDIVLSLAELPIAIRLAGLDRDPGWVAAAGHFIAFHFA